MYKVEAKHKDGSTTAHTWSISGYGRPTTENLAKWAASSNLSQQPDDGRKIVAVRVTYSLGFDSGVVATWKDPTCPNYQYEVLQPIALAEKFN